MVKTTQKVHQSKQKETSGGEGYRNVPRTYSNMSYSKSSLVGEIEIVSKDESEIRLAPTNGTLLVRNGSCHTHSNRICLSTNFSVLPKMSRSKRKTSRQAPSLHAEQKNRKVRSMYQIYHNLKNHPAENCSIKLGKARTQPVLEHYQQSLTRAVSAHSDSACGSSYFVYTYDAPLLSHHHS